MERLKKLIWLAAQDVKAELAGRETYEYHALAELVGVAKSNRNVSASLAGYA